MSLAEILSLAFVMIAGPQIMSAFAAGLHVAHAHDPSWV